MSNNKNYLLSVPDNQKEWFKSNYNIIKLQISETELISYSMFESNLFGINERFLNFYKSVQDVSWPDCKSIQDFDNLPAWIKTEIKQIHNWLSIEPSSEDLRLNHINSTTEEDIVNTQLCIQQLHGNVVHTAIPNWEAPGVKLNFDNVTLVTQLDYARDGFHYDIVTSDALVDKLIPALAQYTIACTL